MFDFGPLAAQHDPDILSYFHETKQVKDLIASNKVPPNFIFVARPGAGKTALVKWLEKGNHARTILTVRSTETRIMEHEEKWNVEDYRILVTAELFYGIIIEALSKCNLPKNLKNKCQKYQRESWIREKFKNIQERFQGLQMLGFGFSLKESDRNDYLDRIRQTRTVDTVKDLVINIAKETNLALVIDDPELIVSRGLKDLTHENAQRIGAFLSVLHSLHCLGVQVITFCKEHVLQNTQKYYSDFSHFAGRVEGLEWTEDDLLEMLKRRIKVRLRSNWQTVFDINQGDFKNKIFPLLVNGPRDLLFICNEAGKNSKKIRFNDLKNSAKALQITKWSEIFKQYSFWPRIDDLAKAILKAVTREFGKRPFTPSQFRELFTEEFQKPDTEIHKMRNEDWINTALWAEPPIQERLFQIGCLGYIRKRQYFYPWMSPSLEGFRSADRYFVSPLFQITES